MVKDKKASEFATRDYTIHLSKRLYGVTFKKRAPRAVREVKKFAQQMMKTRCVRERERERECEDFRVVYGCERENPQHLSPPGTRSSEEQPVDVCCWVVGGPARAGYQTRRGDGTAAATVMVCLCLRPGSRQGYPSGEAREHPLIPCDCSSLIWVVLNLHGYTRNEAPPQYSRKRPRTDRVVCLLCTRLVDGVGCSWPVSLSPTRRD